jgi:hypothetical protein
MFTHEIHEVEDNLGRQIIDTVIMHILKEIQCQRFAGAAQAGDYQQFHLLLQHPFR